MCGYGCRLLTLLFRYLCNTYGESLTEKVFFFVDNRNVIGKDIPFQLIHQKVFGAPMFYKSVVLAHDVDDFSKIWQAMGRSRTMNKTIFAIYKSGVVGPALEANSRFVRWDILNQSFASHAILENTCK